MKSEEATKDIETKLFIQAVCDKYGYDFSQYAKASFERRLSAVLSKFKLHHMAELQHKVCNDEMFFGRVLDELTIIVTELFRDPFFYKALRDEVVPYLKTFSEIKIWHAGVATGEEVYSLAIVLKEEGLYDRSMIYATDINRRALLGAKQGVVNTESLQQATTNYFEAGGKGALNDYYHAKYNRALLDPSLRQNIVFSDHNLVTDKGFGEMQLILCRNVLIYFNRILQERVLNIFEQNLCRGGFLCLGVNESLRYFSVSKWFREVNARAKIFQKRTPEGA